MVHDSDSSAHSYRFCLPVYRTEHEPGCAVKEAVEAGEISYDRYSSYLGMLDEEGKYR